MYIGLYVKYSVNAVAQWLRCCATNRKVAGSIPVSFTGNFFDRKYFRSHYVPGVDSASNRNEYQDYFLGDRRPVNKANNLQPSCAFVMKSGNLNFLEPSVPVQACIGTDLILPLPLILLRLNETLKLWADFRKDTDVLYSAKIRSVRAKLFHEDRQ